MSSTLLKLAAEIEFLSASVASCENHCAEVRHDRKYGVLPRCLFLEEGQVVPGGTQADELSGGTVVVGLNPGKMKEPERRKINGLLDGIGKDRDRFSAENWQAFARDYNEWLKGTVADSVPYYTLVRALLRSAGRKGPILWTEILKCETRAQEHREGEPTEEPDPFNSETVGRCTTKFLKNELSVAPKDWPVLAVGKLALTWCMDNAKGRTVVGVPHASGRSAFKFLSLFPPTHLDLQRLEWTHGKWHWPTDE